VVEVEGHRHIGSFETKGPRAVKPRKEGSAICGSNCQHSGESTLRISKFSRSRKSGHFKSRNNEIRSGSSIIGGRVEEIRAFGRFPERKVVHRYYGNREIGNPVDTRFMHFDIAMSETLIGDRAAIL
jgi:hypothetical protein